MYVSNRMTTNPITITSKTTARKALDIMQSKRFSNIPVVDNGNMVGIVAKEDIINQYFCGERGCTLMEDTLVEEIMTKHFVTVKKMDYIERAVLLLKEKDISALPVMDTDNKLVGIITRSDVFDAFADAMGSDNKGSRIYMVVPEFIGQLAKIANIVRHHGISIEALSVFDSGIINTKQVIMKVSSKDVDQLVIDLKLAGLDVRDVGYL
ncbi:MAG: histidine kinase [Clostridia bacterium]|jgi:acetoin utilization protein AcuB|nr:histidine kinase [Clostridia bacterium]MDF2892058.1 histidine kinase [Clostridia bacterium]